MLISRLMRPVLFVGLLALPGCYGAPAALPPPPPGTMVMGGQCFAGFYVCNLPMAAPVGSQCSCPGLGAPSFGTVR